MLVLSRLVNESVLIGGGIKVTILAVRGNKVSIGIVAPESVRVLREELANCLEEDLLNGEYLEVGLFEAAGISMLKEWPQTLVFCTSASLRDRFAAGFTKTLADLKALAIQRGYVVTSDETSEMGGRRIVFQPEPRAPITRPAETEMAPAT